MTTSHQRQRRWTIAAAAAAAVALSPGAAAFSSPPSRPTAPREGRTTTRLAEGGLLDAIGGAFDSLRRQLVGQDVGDIPAPTDAGWRVGEETVVAASAEFERGTMPSRSAPPRRAGYGKGSASWKTSSAPPPRTFPAPSQAGPPVLKGAAFGGSSSGPSSAAPAKSYGKGGAAKWKTAQRPSGTVLPDAMVRAAEGLASDVVSQMAVPPPTAVAKSYGKGSWKAKAAASRPARQPWEDSNAAPAPPSAAERAVTAHFSAPAAAKSYAKGSWKSSSPVPRAASSAALPAAPAARGAASAPALKGSSSAPSRGYGKTNASWKTAAPKSGGGYLDTFSKGADAVAAEMIDSSRSAAIVAVNSPPASVAKSASSGPTKKYSKTNASWKDAKRADLTRRYSKTNAGWKTAAPKSGGGYLDAVASAAPVATSSAVLAAPAAVEAPSRAVPARSYSKTSAPWKTAKEAAGRQPWEDVNSSGTSVDLMPPPPSSAAVPRYRRGYAKGSWKASASPSSPAAGARAAAPAAKGSAGPGGGFGLGSWKK